MTLPDVTLRGAHPGRPHIIVYGKKIVYAFQRARMHTLTRAAAAVANNENCAWQKNYQHGDRVRYIRMNVFRV
jgi:hypothetical protein